MASQTFCLSTILCYVTGKNFPGPPEHLRLVRHLIFTFPAHMIRQTPVVSLVREELCRQFPALACYVGVDVNDENRDGIVEQARKVVGDTLTVEPAKLLLRGTPA